MGKILANTENGKQIIFKNIKDCMTNLNICSAVFYKAVQTGKSVTDKKTGIAYYLDYLEE